MKILLTNGKTVKWIFENENYNGHDWHVAVDKEGKAITASDETEVELQKALLAENMGLGDFIQRAIKLIPESIRPKHCSKCEQRRLVLNKVREQGVKETIKKLREIG